MKNNDSTAGSGHPAGRWIVRLRRSRWMETVKRWIPQPLRRLAWGMAVAQNEFQIQGSRLFIPAHARTRSLLLDEYEPAVTACLRQHLRAGLTFCDVGANLGVFTLIGAKLVGPSGRVIAFEPVPDNAEVVRRNIILNDARNITLLEKAVAETAGSAQIHLSSHCGCHSLLAQPEAATGRVLTIQTVRLDSLPELRDTALLKVDAEGAEISVLRSLGRFRPSHLIVEYNAARALAAGYDGPQFLAALRELGYTDWENLDEPTAGLQSVFSSQGSVNLHARHAGADAA